MIRALASEVSILNEGAFDSAKGILTLKVIQPGFNKSGGRYYPKDTLARDHKIFEGSKMFLNHQTDVQEKARPEGDVNNWVASIKRTWVDAADGSIMGEAAVIDPVFKAKLMSLQEQGLLKDMAVSIRAIGRQDARNVEGKATKYIESLISARSVDFVANAGAGGQILAMESASLDENDVDLVSEELFRQRRPDLVGIIESQIKERHMNDVEIKALQEASTKLAADLATALTQLKEANDKSALQESIAKKAVVAGELSKLLSESKLPEVAVNRLKAQFKDAVEVVGMKEAIDAEKMYIDSLKAPVNKKNGNAENKEVKEGSGVDMIAAYIRLGLTKEQATIAAGKK